MNIFLTGNTQVGKSTLISRVLEKLPGVETSGFKTITAADVPGAIAIVMAFPQSICHPPSGSFRIGPAGPIRGMPVSLSCTSFRSNLAAMSGGTGAAPFVAFSVLFFAVLAPFFPALFMVLVFLII